MIRSTIKIALKVLARRKFFTLISLFGTSFTLIVLMVVAAMMDTYIRPGGPEHDMHRALSVHETVMSSPDGGSIWSGSPGYRFLSRHVKTMQSPERISIFSNKKSVSYYEGSKKHNLNVRRTDADYWKILDFTFLEGQPFTSRDEREAQQVAVINRHTKELLLEPGPAYGQNINLDGQTFFVTGVVENVPATHIVAFADVWVPISTSKTRDYREAMMGDFQALLLARSRSDFKTIKREYAAVLEQIDWPDPKSYNTMRGGADTRLETLARDVFDQQGAAEVSTGALSALIGGFMLLFMLLPSINLTNINLSRILERASEIGIRKSFGASSRSLVAQFVAENIVLTAIGGLVGFIGAYAILWAITQSGLIPHAVFEPNHRVFGVGILMIFTFGLMSGVYPAWRMARMHPVEALRGGR